MLLFPKKYKFKKHHKQIRRLKNIEFKYFFPKIGRFCLKTKKGYRMKSSQIETIRRIIQKRLNKKMKKKQKLIFGIFPDVCVTKKSSGVRMGKGKGPFDYWMMFVKKSQVICELIVKRRKLYKSATNRLKMGGKFLAGGFTVIKRKKFMINFK